MDFTKLQSQAKERDEKIQAGKKTLDAQMSNIELQRTIVRSFASLVDYLDKNTSKTEVVNQLKQIGTPDALKVAKSVDSLHDTIKSQKTVDLTETIQALTRVLDKEEIDDPDYTEQLKEILSAIKAHQTVVEAPVVNVPAPDLKPFENGLKSVTGAVNKLGESNIKVTHTNVLVDEKFDEWRLVLKDEEPIGIQYYLNDKKVAELKYKIRDERIVGVKKVAL